MNKNPIHQSKDELTIPHWIRSGLVWKCSVCGLETDDSFLRKKCARCCTSMNTFARDGRLVVLEEKLQGY